VGRGWHLLPLLAVGAGVGILQCSLGIHVILCEFYWIELKSLILAQIERWRNALHMQVERQRGATWRRAANG
jgi:hypothetical protein